METEDIFTEESKLELHPENVKQRQDTYSSLSDLNGIDIFSDEFQERVEEVRGMQNQSYLQLQSDVFTAQAVSPAETDEITSKLFSGQKDRSLMHEYETNTTGWSVMDVSLVLIAVLAVTALYLFFFQDKKARRKRV